MQAPAAESGPATAGRILLLAEGPFWFRWKGMLDE